MRMRAMTPSLVPAFWAIRNSTGRPWAMSIIVVSTVAWAAVRGTSKDTIAAAPP